MHARIRYIALGVTLVELMVTLAVLAILMTVGYPMYVTQMQKARRVDARAGLWEMAQEQEREFAKWGGYSEPSVLVPSLVATDGAPAPDANSVFNREMGRIAGEYGDHYSFTINATDSTYTISATPINTQVGDVNCAVFTIDQIGNKTATDVNLCW